MSQPNFTKTHGDRRLAVSGSLLHHRQGRDPTQLAWLAADRPTGSGVQLGRKLLAQWLTGERAQYGRTVRNVGLTWANPLHPEHKVVEPEIRERFGRLV